MDVNGVYKLTNITGFPHPVTKKDQQQQWDAQTMASGE
jgi:hypothetical protein